MSDPFTFPDIPHSLDPNYSAAYEEVIRFYQAISKHPNAQLFEMGPTDSGKPLHLLVVSADQTFSAEAAHHNGKMVLLVNNGIHPGEPCGIDASMLMLKDMLNDPDRLAQLNDVVLCIIPVYNIGGALNRNAYSRANQNGPAQYGFRGNARNLDLNRDFVKCDSRNAQSFTQLFTEWRPHVFIDNHTSNGADYQYTMTIIPTQHNKLPKGLGNWLDQDLMPVLYREMADREWEMCPYVFARDTPDKGIAAFLDYPRYSSGYAALFNTISFMPETHMLKPFSDRVSSTQAFMEAMIETLNGPQGTTLKRIRAQIDESERTLSQFAIDWKMDSENPDTISFKGYTPKYKPSEVSGEDRLYYDQNEPYEKEIPFYKHYLDKTVVTRPEAYIVPAAWKEVLERLAWNGVKMHPVQSDTVMEVETYYIRDYKDRAAYEGHYLHYNVEVEKKTQQIRFRAGDWVIPMDQTINRFLVNVLEPEAPDSYFAWNFFDSILQQKEYFSSYVFEDIAAELLKASPELQKALEEKKKDPEFAASSYRQLEFIYQHSEHYEITHRRYPVYRLMTAVPQQLIGE